MTTSHRPTFKPAMGGSEQGGNVLVIPKRSYTAQDLPGYTTIKERQNGQGNIEDLKYKDFKKDLLERERLARLKKEGLVDMNKAIGYEEEDEGEKIEKKQINQLSYQSENVETKKSVANNNFNPFPQDKDDVDFAFSSSSEDEEENKKKSKNEKQKSKKNYQSSDDQNEKNSDSENKDSDEDSEDDNEILMREYERLKKQKEQDQQQKQQQKRYDIEEDQARNILMGNPLLVKSDDYSLNKRWYEDTVFKNQARFEKKDKKKFINDNVRNEFHYKFLAKYIFT